MALQVIAGSLEAESAGLSFQCHQDGETIDCGVVGDVLHDLLAFHGLGLGDDAFRALLPEIERLANAKSDAGRFEENGTLIVRAADLLRYGFRAKSAPCAGPPAEGFRGRQRSTPCPTDHRLLGGQK
jgi:hypothetical protein